MLILLALVVMGSNVPTPDYRRNIYRDRSPQYLRKDGTRPLQADWDAGNYTITALAIDSNSVDVNDLTVTLSIDANSISLTDQLTSTVTTGTSPFVIASTTLVTNLNADLWDGYQFADYLDQPVRTTDDIDANSLTIADTVTATGVVSGSMLRQTGTWHAYGGFQDKAEALSLDPNTWTHVTNAGNDLFTGLEGDGLSLVDDEMIVANAGDYVGNLSITITGGNSKDFKFRIYNVTKADQMGYDIGASTTVSNYTNISLPMYIECDAGNVLQVQAWCLAGDDPTLRSSIFYITYLHD